MEVEVAKTMILGKWCEFEVLQTKLVFSKLSACLDYEFGWEEEELFVFYVAAINSACNMIDFSLLLSLFGKNF